MKIVGIDLAGKAENPTGFCVLDENNCEVKILHSDTDILAGIEAAKPDIIAIDAPFWIPKFKDRIMPWRPCEIELIKRGFKPLSVLLPTMQMLAQRAAHLVRVLKSRGYNVIEVFPNASEKIFGLERQPKTNEHEYDALICALTGKAYLEGKYENLHGIIIPK